MSSNNILVWQIGTDEDLIRNDIDFNASQQEKVQALGVLSKKNKSDIDTLGKSIDRAHNSVTEVNIKQSDRILDKANRPSVKNEKPWFDVEHIRDSLRFRTSIQELDNVEAIFDLLQNNKIEFIKIDLLKMFNPKSFGWRCSVFDVFLNGQIVEYYHSFAGLIQVNENVAHEIFERWRNCNEEETTAKSEEFRKDLERSSAVYDEEWNKVLSRLKLTEDKALNKWNAMAESIFLKITL